jgi:hypothetical protein
MTRARGIDDRGNSCELLTDMPACALAEVLVEGGWKYALLDDNGVPAGTVALYAGGTRRAYVPAVPGL